MFDGNLTELWKHEMIGEGYVFLWHKGIRKIQNFEMMHVPESTVET